MAVVNLGTDEYCQANDSIGYICERLGARPELQYSGGDRGWIGDNAFDFDCSRMRALRWQRRVTISEATLNSVDDLAADQWLLTSRTKRKTARPLLACWRS